MAGDSTTAGPASVGKIYVKSFKTSVQALQRRYLLDGGLVLAALGVKAFLEFPESRVSSQY